MKSLHNFHGYYYVPNNNVQRQFVYFIPAICRNTLKNFTIPFVKRKIVSATFTSDTHQIPKYQIFGARYSRVDQVKFLEDSLQKI